MSHLHYSDVHLVRREPELGTASIFSVDEWGHPEFLIWAGPADRLAAGGEAPAPTNSMGTDQYVCLCGFTGVSWDQMLIHNECGICSGCGYIYGLEDGRNGLCFNCANPEAAE